MSDYIAVVGNAAGNRSDPIPYIIASDAIIKMPLS